MRIHVDNNDPSQNERPMTPGADTERPLRIWQTKFGMAKLMNGARGFWFALRTDRSVAWKFPVSILVMGCAMYMRNAVDVIAVLVATTVLFAAELFNTAIEELCNFVHPEFDDHIGRIKDVSAAAVMVCQVAWLSVIGYELLRLATQATA
jgi:diacylglycerol kinase (ATP)